jgi:hypothetical protein
VAKVKLCEVGRKHSDGQRVPEVFAEMKLREATGKHSERLVVGGVETELCQPRKAQEQGRAGAGHLVIIKTPYIFETKLAQFA